MRKIATTFTLAILLIFGITVAFKEPPASGQEGTAIPQDIEKLKHINEALDKRIQSKLLDAKQDAPTPKPKVITKTITKTVHPKSVRIYYRVNGEVVSESVLTKEGNFFILDIDSVLPQVLSVPDTVDVIPAEPEPEPKPKRKWWQIKK